MPVYSKERRLEALAEAEQGVSTRETALKFNCSESWVRRVKQKYREQGKTEPEKKVLIDKVPLGQWQTTTFLAGLRATGFIAPLVVNGAINGDFFVCYVQQQLAPVLKQGDIGILDYLSSHKRLEARDAIEAVGVELWFLPPYSPDFNPIEQAFSKFKWLVQSAEERTEQGLWNLCGQLIEHITQRDCTHYILHAGCRYG